MSTSPTTYSSFWPLQILLLSTGLWLVYNIVQINGMRTDNDKAVAQLVPERRAALAAKDRLVALVEDLNRTSAKDPTASQILREFHVQMETSAAAGKQ